MNIKKRMKQIILWALTLFFAMSALVFFPSFSSLFSILIVVLTFPLEKWQLWLSKYFKTGIKVALIVILFVLTVSTAPTSSPVEDVENPSVLGSSQNTSSPENSVTSTPTNSSANVHTHQFQDATCSDPQKCSCGATQGEALGHNWISATCTTPKTCSVCNVTEGTTVNHNWSNATCSSPKTCTECGTTEGNKAEHTWENATCTSPKTCSTCGATEGNAKSHNYSNGKCTACGAKDPNYTSETMVWIPTNGGERYHSKKTCSQMEDPEYVTKSEAISRGFTPCGRCKPS